MNTLLKEKCENILLDFYDRGYYVNVFLNGLNEIVIDIGDEQNEIDIKLFNNIITELMKFLFSTGWKLKNNSYIVSQSLDTVYVCPSCDEYWYIYKYTDENKNVFCFCQNCFYENKIDDFEVKRKNINTNDIEKLINSELKIGKMVLFFER